MKILAALLFASAAFAQGEGGMKDEERSYLKSYMESTRANLLKAVEGVTAAQWSFKPDETSWSVANVLEHLILTEGYFHEATKKMLAAPDKPRIASATAEGDRKVAARIEDRSAKAKAPEMLIPTNQWPSVEAARTEFLARRAKSIEYIATTNDALRAHSGGGNNPMDVYQYWVLVAAHSARHTAQIEELKKHESFPKR
jgi:hypothetical protein